MVRDVGAGVKASVAPLAIVQLLFTVNFVPSVLILLIVVFAGTTVPETPSGSRAEVS